jgi:hypothetical protein
VPALQRRQVKTTGLWAKAEHRKNRPVQGWSKITATVTIARTMIPIQFLQLAGFSAIFNRANYSSRASRNAGFFGGTCYVIPQVLRYTLR